MPQSTTDAPANFDDLFAVSDDPWGFRDRWYEKRKRLLTMACLPQARYAAAYEPGCANGELTACLAARCDQLLASDSTTRAVGLAQRRVAHFAHVTVVQAQCPGQWPQEQFDLIVLSEFGYYLSREEVRSLGRKARASLRSAGTVVACHWRRPIAGCAMTGDQVHALLAESLDMACLGRSENPDFLLEIWCLDGRSVAQREGLA